MAISGETRVRADVVVASSLCRIANVVSPWGAVVSTSIASMRASGGGASRSRASAAATRSPGPSNSQYTAPEALSTKPATPWSAAMRATSGRNPTP